MSLMLGLVFLMFGSVAIYLAVQGFNPDEPFRQQLWDHVLGTVNG